MEMSDASIEFTPEPSKLWRRLLGISLMVLAQVLFASAMIFLKKSYEAGLQAPDTLFVAGIMLMLINGPICFTKADLGIMSSKAWFLIFLRFLGGATAGILLYMGMDYLPVSIGTLLYNIAPIFVVFFACCILNEKVAILKVFTTIFAFAGVVMVTLGTEE